MSDIDQAMADLQRRAGAGDSRSTATGNPKKNRRTFKRWVWRWVATPVFVLTVPIGVLLRGSTTLYASTSWPVWLCVAAAALGSSILLVGGIWWIVRRLGWRVSGLAVRLLTMIVIAFAAYTTLYVSVDNVKSDEIRATYQSLHPLLRLSGGTLFFFDSSSVITDTGRTREDYARMGLPVNESSLHFEQENGYVHAVDLRTVGRSAVRNVVTEWWFKLLGFRTLRHVGTADHLHVSLPVR